MGVQRKDARRRRSRPGRQPPPPGQPPGPSRKAPKRPASRRRRPSSTRRRRASPTTTSTSQEQRPPARRASASTATSPRPAATGPSKAPSASRSCAPRARSRSRSLDEKAEDGKSSRAGRQADDRRVPLRARAAQGRPGRRSRCRTARVERRPAGGPVPLPPAADAGRQGLRRRVQPRRPRAVLPAAGRRHSREPAWRRCASMPRCCNTRARAVPGQVVLRRDRPEAARLRGAPARERGPVRGVPVATTAPVDGRQLPHRIQVRYGDEHYGTFTFDELQAERADRSAVSRSAAGVSPACVKPRRLRLTANESRRAHEDTSVTRCLHRVALRCWPSRTSPAPSSRSRRRSPTRSTRSSSSCSAPAASRGCRPTAPASSSRQDGYILTVNSHILDTPRPARPPVRRPALPRQGRRPRAGAGRRPGARSTSDVDFLPHFDFAKAAASAAGRAGRLGPGLQQPVPDRHARRADVGAARRRSRPTPKLHGRRGIFDAPVHRRRLRRRRHHQQPRRRPAASSPPARASCSASSAGSCRTR